MTYQFEDVFGYNHNTASKIAQGGQGAVYRTQNPNIAVKVAFDSSGEAFSKDVKQNGRLDEIRLLPISKRVHITLPQATLKEYAGYVMTLLDDMESFEKAFAHFKDDNSDYTNNWLERYRETNPDFVKDFAQYLSSGGRRRRLESYLRAACMLSELHASGLVYCDFSDKNVFISSGKENNAVWLIDADNLNFQEKTRRAGIYTPKYGAPEVICGEGCTFYSDSYAFAISFFWQLTWTHPFEGAALESDFDDEFADAKDELVNSGALPWIMDTEDTSNYIVAPIRQDFVISDRLNRYFNRTFCKIGKEKRQTRPTMFEWAEAIAKELDLSVKCKYCDMDYDASNSKCPWCGVETAKVSLVAKNKNRIMWRFVREAENGTIISVPKRIIRGFRNSDIEGIAFTMVDNNNTLTLDDLDEKLEWRVSTDKGDSFRDIYGRIVIQNKCFIMEGTEKKTGETVRIEVDKI